MNPRVFISAGEPSGDLHAAALLPALRRALDPESIDAMGGSHLAQAGAHVTHPICALTAMGVGDVARRLHAHVRVLRQTQHALASGAYDLAVLVDYPGFNLRLARAARRAGVPVLYYIAPQLWAWGAWRASGLRRVIDRLAVILPFEESFFQGRGVQAHFVGHPLTERVRPTREEARRRLGLDPGAPVLALLPGSRLDEVARHWPIFRDAAWRLRRSRPALHLLVAAHHGATYAGSRGTTLVWDDAETVLAAADAAMCKSGTATLQAALAGTPMVIAYRTHATTFALARRLVRVRSIGLVNLVLGERAAPELIQHDVTVEALARTAGELLEGGPAAEQQRRLFADVHTRLGPPGTADRVADLARELVA